MSTTDRERAVEFDRWQQAPVVQMPGSSFVGIPKGSGIGRQHRPDYIEKPDAKERIQRLEAEFAAIRSQATKAALEPLVLALKMISAMAPPDDWEYYAGFGDYNGYEGYGRDDPAYVDEPDTSNNGDMLDFGSAIGRQQAAKIARQALHEVAAELRGMAE